MPLIHSKTPKAFKENIKREIEHGKPQKQAVAIAYSEQRRAGHKHKMSAGGVCEECGYAEGGEVGVHDPSYSKEKDMGESDAGNALRQANHMRKGSPSHGMIMDKVVNEHKSKLSELKGMPKPNLPMAEGGEVDDEPMEHMEMEHEEHMEPDDDGELSKIMGSELMEAFEKKDHKKLLDSLEAVIMNCLSKNGIDG